MLGPVGKCEVCTRKLVNKNAIGPYQNAIGKEITSLSHSSPIILS